MSYFKEVVNSDLLISEVGRRPALYDSSLPDYRDKTVRGRLWEEVCEALFSGWNELELLEKFAKGKETQKRWKALRDCFRRELLNQRAAPAGNGATKRRKYIYFDQLSFLLPTMMDKQTAINENKSLQHDSDDATDEVMENIPQCPTQSSVKNLRKSLEIESVNLHERSPPREEFDDDKAFLMSLLPTLKKFQEAQKLTVRIEIMNAIRKVKAESMSMK